MFHAIKYCQDNSLWNSTRIEPLFQPFDKPNSCNDCICMDQKFNDWLCFLNHVDLNTDLLDNMILHQVVIQPTEKPRSVGPHKLKLKTRAYKTKLYIKNKKLRSASTQLHGEI